MALTWVTLDQINGWLASTKFQVSGSSEEVAEDKVDELEQAAIDVVKGKLGYRYDMATWLDNGSTPSLILTIVAMLSAAYFLQRQISDDEMDAMSYPIRLEARAMMLLDGLATSAIDIPGIEEDPTLSAGKAPLFFPDDASTTLWEDDPTAEGGAPRYFTYSHEF